jgi:thiol-disulfide isomerase/thioredoxin
LENAMISGSYAQEEKEKWDKVKLPLTAKDWYCLEKADSLRKADKAAGKPLHKDIIDSLYRICDSIKTVRRKLDLDYVVKNPGTYLSMFLLGHWQKSIPVDSLVKLFSGFPDSVTKSSLAYDVLNYVYPLTDNQSFRMKYPLHGTAFQNQLDKIRSIHDFKLASITGKEVDLKIFRGKYLVVDVWASWCKPCIANIPAWNALMKEYDPRRIQFVSVSIDDEAAAWKKAVANYKPGGIQMLAENALASLFAVYYKVVYVPKYLIIDQAGHIINYDAPHPGDPQLQVLLNNLVEKRTYR